MIHYGIRDTVWDFLFMRRIIRLFEFTDMESYRELTLEVLCMLTTDIEHIHREMPAQISFRVGGMMHHLTMEEFYITLGVYKPHEVEDPTYRELVYTMRSFDYPALW